MKATTKSNDTRLLLVFGFLAILIRLVFWAYTHRVWEDSLIAILHARNAVRGLGLTHFKLHEGPVDGFTSPLGILIPLLGEFVHLGWGLNATRITSLVAAFGTIYFAIRLNRAYPGLQLPSYAVMMFAGFLAFEHHQILWGMAGMETQLATFVLLFAFFCYQSDRPYRMGMALALVLYIRPDFVFAVCIIGCGLLYRAITQKKPGTITIPVVTSVLLYLPWVLFVSLYYGSPIPNTIRAKAGFGLWWRGGHSFAEIAHGAMDRMNDWLFASLGPSYAGNGTGFLPLWDHGVVAKVIVTLLFIGVIFAVIKKQRDLLLLYVTLFTYWLYYIFAVPGMFGWYVVPFSALTIILAAKGLRDLLASVFPADAATRVGWVVSASYLLIMVSILPITFTGEKHVQELIEGPVRIAIGKYLKSHSPPDATIGGEPLGYVGYYSERNYIDFPGLTSRRSVDFLTQNGVGMNKLFAEFKPDYLVLRKRESDWFAQSAFDGYWFTQEYVLVRQFDVPESDRARILYASNNVDLDFGLWQRKEAYRVQPWLDFDLWPKNPTLLSVDVTLTNWIRITRENQILPRNRPAYSSYVTADADTGKIVMKATVQPGVEVIAVPVFTGPVTSKLILTVQDEDSGRQIAALSPMPVIYTRWKAWLITLPPSGKERHLAFVGEDQGAEWGEWLAIGEPEILPQFPRPLNHNSPHKR